MLKKLFAGMITAAVVALLLPATSFAATPDYIQNFDVTVNGSSVSTFYPDSGEVFINDRNLSWSSCNVAISAFKFLYHQIMKFNDIDFSLPKRKKETRLPQIYSKDELEVIFDSAKILRNQLLLKTAYAAGLRVGELVSLKLTDIDSSRKMIRVNQGKGRKDRYTILSERLLDDLRLYWKVYRPSFWLFPNKKRSDHLAAVQSPLDSLY